MTSNTLQSRYTAVRGRSVALAAPLSPEDCSAQSMPDASPTKWHLAHTTWFFETFILERAEPGFQPFDPAYRVLFNSYYQGVGEQHPRPQRGLVTRPGLAEVRAYRANVDTRIAALLSRTDRPELRELMELGLQHEQQHQELLLTDIKHLLAMNPLHPVYHPQWPLSSVVATPVDWVEYAGGIAQVGHAGAGFGFDNEAPRHAALLRPYALANRLVTHGDWLAFMDGGGYRDPRWWMAAGWDWVQAQGVEAPLYWQATDSGWTNFTLHGRVPLDPHTPVVHISWFEADAYARWSAAQQGAPYAVHADARCNSGTKCVHGRLSPSDRGSPACPVIPQPVSVSPHAFRYASRVYVTAASAPFAKAIVSLSNCGINVTRARQSGQNRLMP